MRLSFRQLPWFWSILLAAVLFLLTIVLIMSRVDGFMALQSLHTPALNFIFGLLTIPGDGVSAVIFILIFVLFFSYRKALTLLSGYLIGSLVVQSCKIVFFNPTPRPVMYFELEKIPFLLPQGLNPALWNSFPSGHSASAATLFLFLAGINRKPSIQIMCAAIALLVGYSRIYLYMHFPIDVCVGYSVGLISMYFADRWITSFFQNNPKNWEHKKLIGK